MTRFFLFCNQQSDSLVPGRNDVRLPLDGIVYGTTLPNCFANETAKGLNRKFGGSHASLPNSRENTKRIDEII